MGMGDLFAKVSNAFTYAAPRTRPPGLSPEQPYEPEVDGRAPRAIDWVPSAAIRVWYGLPVSDWLHGATSRKDNTQPKRVFGIPGARSEVPAGATRVAVIGDFGEGTPSQTRIARQMAAWQPERVATVGDNVYPVGREADWKAHYDAIYDPKVLPPSKWQPALGNHDYYSGDLRPYFKRFPQLQGRAYYDWAVGSAQFFVVDSEQRTDPASAQYRWLEGALAASKAPLKIVQLHRPIYSTSENLWAQRMRGSLGPLFARHGVDLVLQGHEHGYERSKAIDGVTYVVTGGGGAQSTEKLGTLPDRSVVRSGAYHWLQLALDGTRLIVNAVDDYGRHLDGFVLNARSASAAREAANGVAALETARAA